MRFSLTEDTKRSAFATRVAAAGLRARLSEVMSELLPGDALVLDLGGVEAMTISFADELFAKLVKERALNGTTGCLLLLTGASPEIRETIEVALERRSLFVVNQLLDRSLELLSAPVHLAETYRHAQEMGEFTARDLADRLEITLPAANNRIKALAELGAVTRKRHDPAHGGRQFIYQAPAA